MAKWILKKSEADLKLMSETLKISEVLAQVLVNRGVRTKKNALKYLYPKIESLYDTKKMKDVEKAITIIEDSRDMKDKIAIYGDYDVDGVTSTVILTKALREFGCDVIYYIPHRELEGYGLNKEAVRKLYSMEVDLIITCDNGITSLEEVKLAKELGMKIIIIDHHEPSFLEDDTLGKVDVIPSADAVINAKQKLCEYPFKLLCAAGVCYKFVLELFNKHSLEFDKDKELIIFATIATFCDIVDLQDENRILAKNGLDFFNNLPIKNLGLRALLKAKSIENKKIGSFEVGFIIGPCINATGRLERATVSVELFLSENIEEASFLASRLSDLNDERKKMTMASVEKAVTDLLENPFNISPVIIIFDREIHESIAGIVAGRVKDMFFHPTIVLTQGEDFVKGSARSIEVYNIFDNLYNCRDLFERFGGHAMAAGLSLKEENIEKLRTRLNENCTLKREDFTEIIKIDQPLDLDFITYDLAMELKTMEPFGKGNKEPLFGTKSVQLEQLRMIEEKNTLIMTFRIPNSMRRIKAICFGKVEQFKDIIYSLYDEYTCDKIIKGILRDTIIKLDIVYSIDINEYNNDISVQLKLKDFRKSLE